MEEAKELNYTDDLENEDYWNDESNFTPFIRGNPFKEKLKSGYSIVIQCPPASLKQLYECEEKIDNEFDKLKYKIIAEIRDLPREQADARLDEIFNALNKW